MLRVASASVARSEIVLVVPSNIVISRRIGGSKVCLIKPAVCPISHAPARMYLLLGSVKSTFNGDAVAFRRPSNAKIYHIRLYDPGNAPVQAEGTPLLH